jgi:hypothetical protein
MPWLGTGETTLELDCSYFTGHQEDKNGKKTTTSENAYTYECKENVKSFMLGVEQLRHKYSEGEGAKQNKAIKDGIKRMSATIAAGATFVQKGMKKEKEAKEGAYSSKMDYGSHTVAKLSSAPDIDTEKAEDMRSTFKRMSKTKDLAYYTLLKSPDKTIKIVGTMVPKYLAKAVLKKLGNEETKEALKKLLKQSMGCALSIPIAVGSLGAAIPGAVASCVQFLGASASYIYTSMDTHRRARRFSEEPDDPDFVNDMLFTQAYVKSLQDLPGGDDEYEFKPITVQTLQQTVCAVQTIEKYQKTTRDGLKSTQAEWVAAQKHAVAFTHKLREMLNQAVNMETLTMLPKLAAANFAATLVQPGDIQGPETPALPEPPDEVDAVDEEEE